MDSADSIESKLKQQRTRTSPGTLNDALAFTDNRCRHRESALRLYLAVIVSSSLYISKRDWIPKGHQTYLG